MRKTLSLILIAFLLTACAQVPAEITVGPVPAPTEAGGSLSVPSGIEAATQGAVTAFTLNGRNHRGPYSLGGMLLMLSQDGTSTELTLYSSGDVALLASVTLPDMVSPEDRTLQVREDGGGWYHGGRYTLLDDRLEQILEIQVPEDALGVPFLNESRSALFYTTQDAVMVLDVSSGLRKPLKDGFTGSLSIQGLLLQDQRLWVLRADGENEPEHIFLSTQTGQEMARYTGYLEISGHGSDYYSVTPCAASWNLLFGSGEQEPKALIPATDSLPCTFLPDGRCAVTMEVKDTLDGMILDRYDLASGLRTARVTIPTELYIMNLAQGGDGCIYFALYDTQLHSDLLYRWDPEKSPTSDQRIYTGPYYTAENPDYAGLALCRGQAADISARFGSTARVWADGILDQPEYYALEAEYLVHVLSRELLLLEHRLGNYPPGFLKQLSDCCGGLTINLVRSIRGLPGGTSLSSADGLQFRTDSGCHIALTAQADTERTLYHELCHIIDTQILNTTGHYDSWDSLNPRDFAYANSYTLPYDPKADVWIQGGSRYFIDAYSTTFPKEDRARIMEYAMTEGNEEIFREAGLQRKLFILCTAIREAFCLQDYPEPLLWEQYLDQ